MPFAYCGCQNRFTFGSLPTMKFFTLGNAGADESDEASRTRLRAGARADPVRVRGVDRENRPDVVQRGAVDRRCEVRLERDRRRRRVVPLDGHAQVAVADVLRGVATTTSPHGWYFGQSSATPYCSAAAVAVPAAAKHDHREHRPHEPASTGAAAARSRGTRSASGERELLGDSALTRLTEATASTQLRRRRSAPGRPPAARSRASASSIAARAPSSSRSRVFSATASTFARPREQADLLVQARRARESGGIGNRSSLVDVALARPCGRARTRAAPSRGSARG